MRRVVVVGAGLAGLAAARGLAQGGAQVLVVEAAPRPGGRLATRAVEGGQVDHGAAYFTARDPEFRAFLDPLLASGTVTPWAERLHRWDGARLAADALTQTERRFCLPEGMSCLAQAAAEGLQVRLGTRAVALEALAGTWLVRLEDAAGRALRPEEADVVVVAIPAPQALQLARTAESSVDAVVLADLARVELDPCLVVVAGYDAPAPGWRAIASTAEPLQWIGLESSKRPSRGLLVAIHATGAWSRAHFEAPEAEVIAQLTEAAAGAGGGFLRAPRWAQVERWRWARATLLASARALLSDGAGPPLAFCGDWCQAPRVEGAWQSGLAAAERVVFAGYA